MAFSSELLSGSTDGVGVTVVGTGTGSADTVHTASATADVIDEIWIWAHNVHTADVVLTVEWGDTTRPMVLTVPKQIGAVAVIPGWKLKNSKTVKVFAATTNVIMLAGYVTRFTP